MQVVLQHAHQIGWKNTLEGGKYLELAEKMISARGIPLTGSQIIEFASEHGVLPYENYDTVVKTLQARIAEDIAKHRNKSRFLRTGIGTYFLRRLAERKTIFGAVKWSPGRAPRQKPEHPHRILTVPKEILTPNYFTKGWDRATKMLEQGEYDYQSEIRSGFVPVVTGVVLKWQTSIFSYNVGIHTHFERAVGSNSVILRKFLDEFDLDLFENDGTGITSSTARTALPVLSEGRKARLENGKLSRAERLHFFQVSELLIDKAAFFSSSTESFVLLSTIDLSDKYEARPTTQRRMELNCARWTNLSDLKQLVDEDDSVNFISSTESIRISP